MNLLPPGFEFRPSLDGPGLFLGEDRVAIACPARDEPGAPWRLCLSPRGQPRYEFLPDEAACVRYMAAWARRWDTEIREACASTAHPYSHLATSGLCRPDTRHPRGRARRRPGPL